MFCTCSPGRYPKCSHAKKMHALYTHYDETSSGASLYTTFMNSFLYDLFKILIRGHRISLKQVSATTENKKHGAALIIQNNAQNPLITYLVTGDEQTRFTERIGTIDKEDRSRIARDEMISHGVTFILSETERCLVATGNQSSRMAEEKSLWYRTAYHLFREYDETKLHPEIIVDKKTGAVSMALIHKNRQPIMHVYIPEKSCLDIIHFLNIQKPETCGYTVDATDRELLFTLNTNDSTHSTIITPVISISDDPHEPRHLDVSTKFMYGNLIYNPDENKFYTLGYDSAKLLAKRWDTPEKIHNNDLSAFFEKNAGDFSLREDDFGHGESDDLFMSGSNHNFKRLLKMPIVDKFDNVTLIPHALDRSWFYLSAIYTFGTSTVSLYDFFKAKQAKNRFIVTPDAIIDCRSPDIEDSYTDIMSGSTHIEEDGRIAVTKATMLQLTARKNTFISSKTPKALASKLKSMLHCKPAKKLRPLTGLKTTLRHYQETGVSWLLYLYDNNFGGLLCDEMGLGKTHQIIGLLIALRQQRKQKDTSLIVCPTTVIYHWHNLITTYAPELKIAIYYGTERSFEEMLPETDVLLTSYGILRQDIDKITSTKYSIAVFDEIQYLKNKETLGFKAAETIRAVVKYGLTGTPIENSLSDLKALFDIVLPGYLGSDQSFNKLFLKSTDGYENKKQRKTLQRIINPFILRRTKESVLSELPLKIEDHRTCRLSDEQAGMYRDMVKKKGRTLLSQLKNVDQQVPYMHIFSLLNFLKMVCNHPAIALKCPDDYENYDSGKWDLFTELLIESLISGQKVVVFSQYLDMISIIEKYLTKNKIASVTLTGSTTNRGDIINTFANDPECKVFIGSLKAGGIGIDLVAASVVIHYDRWWNAAREDQATDRIHRIGQKHGVQVIKLTTEGTLEEKIGAIIAKKKMLASLITEDDSDDAKFFARDELITILEHSVET